MCIAHDPCRSQSREVPVGIVFLNGTQLHLQVCDHALDKDLAAESGHPYDVVLGSVDGVSRLCAVSRMVVYRKTRDLAHTPAFTGGDLPLD
jgi:hypothetical protein